MVGLRCVRKKYCLSMVAILAPVVVGFFFSSLLSEPLYAQRSSSPAAPDNTNTAATETKAAEQLRMRAEATARIVLGILSYVRWPSDLTTIKLCIVGTTQHADVLLRAGSLEMPNRQTLDIRRYDIDHLPADCGAVYAGDLEKKGDWQHILAVQKQRVTIGEYPDQCQAGGTFCLEWHNGNMSFSVNLDSVARSQLRIHPNVLRLARRNGEARP